MTVINESWTAKGFTPAAQVPGRNIEHIDIHHWGERGQTHDGVVAFFCTTGPGSTSAHYVVSGGRIDCIVSDADVAWHSGVWSENLRSIGIECRPEATDADYATVAELVRTLRARYGDLPLHGHREFFPTACPGVWDLERLDRLARTGTVTPQSTPVQEDDMPLTDADVKKIWQLTGSRPGKTIWSDVVDTRNQMNQLIATVTGLTTALSVGTGLTEDQITEAVKSAFVDLVRE